MRSVEEHIRQANLIFNYVYEDNFSPLYFNTNEKLKTIFDFIPVFGKTVLTPLASSDQLFSSYYCGASRVDAFDINELTFNYFYLRLWSLIRRGYLDVSHCDNTSIAQLLPSSFRTFSEARATMFWETLLECHPSIMTSNLFYTEGNDYYQHSVPFAGDLLKLQKIMKDKELNFYSRDFYTPIDIDNKYKVILLSNILEYHGDDVNKLRIARDNLSRLLADDGVIVATNLMYGEGSPSFTERQIMETEFIFKNGPWQYNSNHKQELPVYYTYQKKVLPKKG